MNANIETLKRFESETGCTLYIGLDASNNDDLRDFVNNRRSIQEACYIEIYSDNGVIKFKTPSKKEVNFEYLYNKMLQGDNNCRVWVNLQNVFAKILPSYNFYAASYGVGMDAYFKSHDKIMQIASPLIDLLDSNNIEYYTEYSDAAWVFRFKISRSKENIERLMQIVNR